MQEIPDWTRVRALGTIVRPHTDPDGERVLVLTDGVTPVPFDYVTVKVEPST